MNSFRKRLNNCIEWLEIGGTIQVNSGHTLAWSEEHEAPGFAATSTCGKTGEQTEILLQVDSDVAWDFLIKYAREQTEPQATIMAGNVALNLINRERVRGC
jgi:hypothetical protein